jgi:branched-subunit amino acid transport protein
LHWLFTALIAQSVLTKHTYHFSSWFPD